MRERGKRRFDVRDLRQDVAHARWLWRRRRREAQTWPGLAAGIERFRQRWPDTGDDAPEDRPILLAAAGWRSGSTLVQRLLMSDPDTVIWGEPYNRLDLVRRLAEPFRSFTPDYPTADIRWPADVVDHDLTAEWVANLYPEGSDLLEAHRAFHLALFAHPASRVGASRWGIKAVRLDADHARYLRLVFPKTCVVFQVRDPYAAYDSYRRQGNRWYDRWPDRPAFTPVAFGRLWARTASSFVDSADELGALLIRYETLGEAATVERLATHTGLSLDPAVLEQRVTQAEPQRRFSGSARRWELAALERTVAPVAERLGYHMPTVR